MMEVRSYCWGRWGRNRPLRFSRGKQAPLQVSALQPPKDYPVALKKPGFFARIASMVRRVFNRGG